MYHDIARWIKLKGRSHYSCILVLFVCLKRRGLPFSVIIKSEFRELTLEIENKSVEWLGPHLLF